MMVSPEWYYEENLKGKTVDELKSRIRSLKRKIRKLQKEIDDPKPGGCMLCPGPEVELVTYELYLQKARQTLLDTIEYLGGEK